MKQCLLLSALAILAPQRPDLTSARRVRSIPPYDGVRQAADNFWRQIRPAPRLDVSALNKDQIKTGGAVVAGVVSNVVGIPLDKFRVLVAQDLASSHSVMGHFRDTFASPQAAFTGALARISMKQLAAFLNLSVPAELREERPFVSAFGVGLVSAPILNIPRILQLGKVAGDSYVEVLRKFFTSPAGIKNYVTNTAMFAPGEGFRMCMCFGTKDYLMPLVGGKEDPRNVTNIPLFAAKLAGIVGPLVAMVETTAALATETATTIHAKTSSGSGTNFQQALRETMTPEYAKRCGSSLFMKNVFANTSLFWVMFMSDFYLKRQHLLENSSMQ